MRRRVLVLMFFLIAVRLSLYGQKSGSNYPPPDAQKLGSLTNPQRQGAYLFKQRCNVCHALDMEGSIRYGLPLSKETVQGNEDPVRKQIMDGSPRMPGFRYGLQSNQIDSIIEYLKTVEKP
jgi:mono/diheme cytochrome c family protein